MRVTWLFIIFTWPKYAKLLNIVNEDDLMRIDEYFEDISFNKNNLDKVYELKIGNEYSYRGLNFIFEGSDIIDNRYVQLLINVDGEKAIVNNYFQIKKLYACREDEF